MTKAKPLPTQQELLELLVYDPESGALYWRVLGNRGGREGKRAGRVNGRGWRRLRVRGLKYKSARIIWRLVTGEDPGEDVVDHCNRKRDDDRWVNLEVKSLERNSHNLSRRKDSPEAQGVTQRPSGTFRARIRRAGRRVSLGNFATAAEAGAAYHAARDAYEAQHPRRVPAGARRR